MRKKKNFQSFEQSVQITFEFNDIMEMVQNLH